MKKIQLLCVFVLGIASLTACRSSRIAQTQDTKSIVILYDNDVHCSIEGYPKMAGLRDAIRDTAWCELVSSGDFLQGGTPGAISNGQYIADVMKHMGYAAITLGNHEFDYGLPRMKELLSQINAPITCSNLFKKSTNKLVYEPFIMKKIGSKKVAFVGATTPTTLYTEAYAFTDENGSESVDYDLCEKTLYSVVQNAVDKARKAGADYVIAITHVGEDDNICHTNSHDLIKETNGIDAVLDGHTHSVIPHEYVNNKDGQPVLISQTGTKFEAVGKLILKKDGSKMTTLVPMSELSRTNARVQQATDSVKNIYNAQVNRLICESEVPLTIYDDAGVRKIRVSETNAGDLVTDAFCYVTGADFAITNGGGIRTSLKAGKLTYGDVISLLPYENYIIMVEVTGQKVLDLLNDCVKFLPAENGDFPQVSGLQYTINMNAAQRVTDVKVFDKETNKYNPIDVNARYKLGTIDYCVTGGGLQNQLKDCKILQENIMLYNEALIKYVTEKLNGHIGQEYASPKGRIIFK